MGKMLIFNSLAPVRLNWMFRWAILKLMLVIVGWSISCEIDLRWISLDLTVSMEGNGLVPCERVAVSWNGFETVQIIVDQDSLRYM